MKEESLLERTKKDYLSYEKALIELLDGPKIKNEKGETNPMALSGLFFDMGLTISEYMTRDTKVTFLKRNIEILTIALEEIE